MLLSRLLQAVPLQAALERDPEVSGIAYDSRRVVAGDCYFALPGLRADGHAFIAAAVSAGAAAVVAEHTELESPAVPVALVDDSRRALALAAANLNGRPSERLYTVGVTGTDGKTTTCAMLTTILEAAGVRTGLISTVSLRSGGRTEANPDHITTPEAPEVQARLREMVEAGDRCAVIETSSHALRMQRVVGVDYDVALLTNVTAEHLDLHGTIEEYRRDKARLFELLGAGRDKGIGKTGVVNLDDPNAALFIAACAGEVVSYGFDARADLRIEAVDELQDGLRFGVRRGHAQAEVHLPMLGTFNVPNAVAAIAAAAPIGVGLEQAASALARFPGVPGRMQVVDEGQPFAVIVDYAHTAEALAVVLRQLRRRAAGRLIVVFGSAGERDRAKRPAMGAVAARLSDFAVLADEDPRGEDRVELLREIAAGLEAEGAREGERYRLVPDRREALSVAFESAAPGDTVLLAGKGHENTIETGSGPLPWDEVETARALLRGR